MKITKSKKTLWVAALLLGLTSCAPTRIYKTLEKGEQRVTASLGGPMVQVPGVATIPIPYTTVGYARGITENFTAQASFHPTASIFGVAQMDFSGAYSFNLPKGQTKGLSVGLGGNFMVDVFEKNASLYPQFSVNYYHNLLNYFPKKKHSNESTDIHPAPKLRALDLYLGTENWVDLRPRLAHEVPNPNFIQWSFHLGAALEYQKWSFLTEFKLLAPNLNNQVVVDYVSPLGDQGALGLYFGIQRKIGVK